MKYILSILFSVMLLSFNNLSAENRINNIRELDTNGNGVFEEGEVDENTCYQTGPGVCYCPMTRFSKHSCCVKKCISEPYTVEKKCFRWVEKPYKKKCCRYVDEPYERQRCRMVPEKYTVQCSRTVRTCCGCVEEPYEKECTRMVPETYTETCTRRVPEYYYEEHTCRVPQYYTETETRYRKRWVTEEKCFYKPKCFIEKRCVDTCPCDSRMVKNERQQNTAQENQNSYSQKSATESNNRNKNPQELMVDSALTQKIKNEINNRGFLINNESIDIQVDNGQVALSGSVSSRFTKERIGNLVRKVDGVRLLNNNLQVAEIR